MARRRELSVAVILFATFWLSPLSTLCDTHLSIRVESTRNDAGELIVKPTVLNSSSVDNVTLVENRTSERVVTRGDFSYVQRGLRVVYRIPVDPIYEYFNIKPYGRFKYHTGTSVDNMHQACQKEDATVAYPEESREALDITDLNLSGDKWISLGLKKNGTRYSRVGAGAPPVSLPEQLWSENGKDGNGECVALHPNTSELHSISCDVPLPFFCKKPFPPREYVAVGRLGSYKYYIDLHVDEVNNVCEHDGAQIAYPESPEEVQAIIDQTDEDDAKIFVGILRELSKRHEYHRIGYQNSIVDIPTEFWGTLQPDYSGNCIVLYRATRKLHDVNCEVNYPFVCKKLRPYVAVDGFGSYVSHDKTDINKMEKTCKRSGGHVAYPTSVPEANVIINQTEADDALISVGLMRKPMDNTLFHRVGRRDLTVGIPSELWDAQEPNYDGNCIALSRRTGKLRDVDCQENLPFVCKKDLTSK